MFPYKRQKLDKETTIKPWGNYMIDKCNGILEIRTKGLGLFSAFPDALLIDFFYTYIVNPSHISDTISPPSVDIQTEAETSLTNALQTLGTLSQCSKAFYIYTYHDPLWRDITLKTFKGNWCGFKHSWRSTLKHILSTRQSKSFIQELPLLVENLYSDYLFASNYCANVDINTLCDVSLNENGEIDVCQDTIQRISNVSIKDFRKEYLETNTPCIITDQVKKWKASTHWTINSLLNRFGDTLFRAESIDLSLNEYAAYLKSGCKEESPLYLFDKKFVSSCKGLGDEFDTPDYFREDLFKVLGDKRPDHRWIIIGPERSGSTFHIDPNSSKK